MKKNKGKVGVYAGTFDVLTKGHLWTIREGAKLFDTFYVSIGENPGKKCLFSIEERTKMLRDETKHIPNITITSFPFQYLMHYAQKLGAQFVLRGIRGVDDYEKEKVMRHVNNDISDGIDNQITTIFLMPPRDLAEISSSMVKGLIGPKGWEDVVKRYVPEPVFKKLLEVHHESPR